MILLMAEIHQLIGSLSHITYRILYTPGDRRISAINSINSFSLEN